MVSKKAIFVICILLMSGLVLAAETANAAFSASSLSKADATPTPRVATEEELQRAYAEWSLSGHADTFDDGIGANTTCAKCKSPQNWDPENKFQEQSLNCYSCKRIPGEPRPDLSGSVKVEQSEWMNIGCDVCHQPIGDSYSVGISFFDPVSQSYLAVEDTSELCAKCHEGRHGFEVIEEQNISPAHNQWKCTQCHGVHGDPAACTDCHDPQSSSGAGEHARHPSVNCTACHDQGKLGIWQDEYLTSKHYDQYMPIRFGHSLRSWPSHNLSKVVSCKRCHHPGNREQPVLAQEVSCEACHPEGAVLFWCEFLIRDGDPNALPIK